MGVENNVQKFADNFWKYASDTKGILSIEDVYIDWANNSNMTIKEFGQVWSKIHDDISTKFGLKKADVSFSRIEDIFDLADKLKGTDTNLENTLPVTEEPITPEPEPGSPSDIAPIGGGAPPTSEPLASEPSPGGGSEPGMDTGPDLDLVHSLNL